MYLIRLYVQVKACAREEPVPTLRCADSAYGRFSSRHRNHGEEQNKKRMDRGMASSLPTEKLDRSNYASWSYKMHQYLLGHGYWSYVDGANDAAPESTHRDFPAWE